MPRVQIPVALMEYEEGGNTIWIHNAQGMTVLRLKAKRVTSTRDCTNLCAHSDIVVNDDVTVCVLSKKKKKP